MNHRWQSESTDGPKGGCCVYWGGCNGCSGHLTTTAGCSVECSAVAVAVVGAVVVVV